MKENISEKIREYLAAGLDARAIATLTGASRQLINQTATRAGYRLVRKYIKTKNEYIRKIHV